MFFVLSKVVYFLIAPSHLCLIAMGSGLALQARTSSRAVGRYLVTLGLVGFIVLGFSPVGSLMLYPLEERFSAPKDVTAQTYDGIILLGGFEDGKISKDRNTLALLDAGERLSETVRLARRLPNAKVIFTGGAGAIFLEAVDAGGPVGQYFRDVGIAAKRIVVENASRNTWENALFTKQIVQPSGKSRYLLLTSAYHMPRAMGIFRQAGFNVDPYPVDYRVSGADALSRPFSTLPDGLKRVDIAMKEWIGLLVYWISGRSNALFPK